MGCLQNTTTRGHYADLLNILQEFFVGKLINFILISRKIPKVVQVHPLVAQDFPIS